MADGTARFAINPALDPAQYAPQFAGRGRVHLPDFLVPPGAEQVHRYLAESAAWSLVLHDGTHVREATPEQRRHADEVWEREMAAFAYARAREGFEFLYEHRKVSDDPRERAADPSPVARFVDFLNSPVFLEFARRLTGQPDIVRADAQATRYRPGDFLTQHDDFDKTGRKLRRAPVEARKATASVPPAPPRLSMTTCWPSASVRRGPTRRAVRSLGPPGG
jgi:Rps23 Pro-64 3,4-dihydroxylase Tpa1-like proline 4-hydroxylase